MSLAPYRKTVAAVLGVLTTVLAVVVGQFADNAYVQLWGPIAAALLSSIGVYFVKNEDASDPNA